MNRAAAQLAINEAFADGLKHSFSVLVANLIARDPDAVQKFERGIAANAEAHAEAELSIARIFKD